MKDILIIKILIVAACTIFWSSCDSFSVIVPIEVEEQTPLLAVGAYFSNEMDEYNISVSSSVGALGRANIENQTGASVRLYEDGALFEEFIFDEFEKVSFDKTFVAGRTYKLEVDQDEFESINTEAVFPSLVEIDSAVLSSSGSSDLFDEDIRQLTVYFDDPQGADYYEVRLYELGEEFGMGERYPVYPASNQLLGQVGTGAGLFFTDQSLAGGVNFLQMNFPIYEGEFSNSYIVELRHINRDYFSFDISMNQALEGNDNPFSEPVQVYNTIENGFGVLGFWNSSYLEIEL